MCDTLWVPGEGRSLFAKSSDRPVGEAQVVQRWDGRRPGAPVRTQYLELDDVGAAPLLGSRPHWLWGLEHGVNDHRVAVGNERVWTIDDPAGAPAALIGMDLVRLALERARTASAAVDVVGELIERHGQGGPAEGPDGEPYWSSFLIADPAAAWVLETSGARRWAARPVAPGTGAAISNRLVLDDGWQRGSEPPVAGRRFDDRRDPAWAAIADVRLACTLPAVSDPASISGPADLAALLRHHGGAPWGRPGDDPAATSPLPAPELGPDGTGVTVCMHVRGLQVTAASMICELPGDPEAPLRAWVALGSPCSSLYLPVFPTHGVPADLASSATWARFDALRARAEDDPAALGETRAVLGPLEARLWAMADEAAGDHRAMASFGDRAWPEVLAALAELRA